MSDDEGPRLLTASALERAEKCPPSQSLPWAREEFEQGRRGTELHSFCVRAAVVGREQALAECPPEWKAEAAAIDVSALPHTTGSYAFEVAFGYLPDSDIAFELGRDVGREVYAALNPRHELGGTADLVGLAEDAVVVLDLKTGRKWLPEPKQSLQLGFLALAASRAYGKPKAIVGWIRLLDSTPRLVLDTLEADELDAMRERLQALRRRVAKFAFLRQKPDAKVALHVGDWCRYCPGIRACWAHTTALPETGDPLLQYADQLAYVELLERRAKMAREQLDAQAKNTPLPLPDGRVYGPRLSVRRSITPAKAIPVLRARHPELDVEAMASITIEGLRRAGLDTEVELRHLEAAGAVVTTEVERMESHKP